MRKINSIIHVLFLAVLIIFSYCKREEAKPTEKDRGNPQITPPTSPGPNPSIPVPPIVKSSFMSVAGVYIYRENSGNKAFFFKAGMTIDADGAYKCYHSNNDLALSPLEMAGSPGNWWGLVTDEKGDPYIQGPADPAPGYYVSQTALEDPTLERADPNRYVDALVIPYIVIPSELKNQSGARLGDFAVIYNKNFDKTTYAIFADIGPVNSIGEASIAAAHNLGYELKNKMGGTKNGITYLVFPGSGNGKKRTVHEINYRGDSLLNSWGGLKKLKNIL